MEKSLAGYIRVSTEMQAERDSLINQDEIVSSFARAKGKDLKLYRDAGISAKDKERPAFKEMLEDIRQGLVEAVVVTKLDRITRSLKDLIFLKEFFEEHGVSFISVNQHLDTSTPMGRFSFYILGLVAELEREITAERVAEDMKGRAKRKKWNGGVIPFGFTSQIRHYRQWLAGKARKKIRDPEEKRSLKEVIHALEQDPAIRQEALAHASRIFPEPKILMIDSEEAGVIKSIFDLYIKQKSFRSVVHSLNSRGIRTREGQPWSSTSIRRILQNPVYYGALTYNKRKGFGKTSRPRPIEEHIVVEDVFEPIISKERFLEVQGLIFGQRTIPPSSKGSSYLLTGLLECQFCGTKMYGYTNNDSRKEGRVYRYYRCNGHSSKGSAVCPGNTIDCRQVEEIILGELKNLSTNPELLQEKTEGFKLRFDDEIQPLLTQQKEAQQALAKIGRRGNRLLTLYEEELIDKQEFIKERGVLDSEKKFIEGELEEINQKIFSSDVANFDLQGTLSSIRNLGDVFEELDLQERKELIRTVINKIEVGKHHLDCQVLSLPKSFVNCEHMVRDSWPPPA
jgi:site-specific DNA recombinase